MICEQCGATLQIGCFPFCPHEPYGGTTIGDEIPGGQVIENLGHETMTFYSKRAIAAEADRRGLRIKDEWAGPHDRVLQPSAGVTAKMLRDADALLRRGADAKTPSADGACATLKTSVREFTIPGVTVEVES